MCKQTDKNRCTSLLQRYLPYGISLFFALFFVFDFPALYIVSLGKTISAPMVMLIYFSGSFALLLRVERNKAVKRHKWTPTVAGLLTMEFYFFLLFAQYYLIPALLLIAAAAAMRFWVCRELLRTKPPQRRTRRFSKFCKDESAVICVYLAVVLFLIPSGIGLFKEYVDVFSEKDWALLAESVSEKGEDAEGASKDQLLTELSRWEELDVRARFCLLCEVGLREEQHLGIENCADIRITYDKLNPYNLAFYDDERKTICINTSVLYQASCREALNTLLHEVFHAFQDDLLSSLDFDSDLVKSNYYYATARQWKDNMENYTSGIQDFSKYESQPLEASARSFAEERVAAYLPDANDSSG